MRFHFRFRHRIPANRHRSRLLSMPSPFTRRLVGIDQVRAAAILKEAIADQTEKVLYFHVV
jgi:hypothetical protein